MAQDKHEIESSAITRLMRLDRIRQHRATGRRLIMLSCVGLIVLDASWLFSAGFFTTGLTVLSLAGVAAIGEIVIRIIEWRPGERPGYRVQGM